MGGPCPVWDCPGTCPSDKFVCMLHWGTISKLWKARLMNTPSKSRIWNSVVESIIRSIERWEKRAI